MTSNTAHSAGPRTLADRLWPGSSTHATLRSAAISPVVLRPAVLRTLTMVVVGVGFIALLAQLRLQLGPVPVTGQTLAVLLLGAAYGTRLGVLTTVAYAVLGAAGLPLFAGGQSGVAYLLGPTGGYLLGFVLAGVTWLQAALGGSWSQAFALGVAPFLLGDVIKLALAVGLLPSVWRWLGRGQV